MAERPSGKDRVRYEQRAAVRLELLRQPEVQRRLAELREQTGRGGVEQLAEDLEHAVSTDELVRLVYPTARRVPFLNSGQQRVVGRPGRGRTRERRTIELVARSLALRADGWSPTQADQRAADEHNAGLKLRYHISAQAIADFRYRLRADI